MNVTAFGLPNVHRRHARYANSVFSCDADGVRAYSTEYPTRCVPGTPFKPGVVTCDGMNIVVIGADKGSRDAIFVFHARNGSLVNKIPLKQSATKVGPPTFGVVF